MSIGPQGYVLVDKPHGWTSFDVVAKIRGRAKQSLKTAVVPEGQTRPKHVKVGHTGTLDPLATGLLVILVGDYTKRAIELTKADKTYQVSLRLGQTSTTGDEEGEKADVSDRPVSREQFEQVLPKFRGDIVQTPPIYSAMKVNGVRAYKLAREGKEVVLEPRPARINRLELTKFDYPYAEFVTDVSSGTYIRSLVEDIGRELETGAYMTDLRRIRVGDFRLEDALTVEQLLAQSDDGNLPLQQLTLRPQR